MTAVAKTSKAVKNITSTVRQHLDAVDRAREIYLAQMKRAEAEYFDRIQRAAAIVAETDAPTIIVPPEPSSDAA